MRKFVMFKNTDTENVERADRYKIGTIDSSKTPNFMKLSLAKKRLMVLVPTKGKFVTANSIRYQDIIGIEDTEKELKKINSQYWI